MYKTSKTQNNEMTISNKDNFHRKKPTYCFIKTFINIMNYSNEKYYSNIHRNTFGTY